MHPFKMGRLPTESTKVLLRNTGLVSRDNKQGMAALTIDVDYLPLIGAQSPRS
jgi:hypothetical protein